MARQHQEKTCEKFIPYGDCPKPECMNRVRTDLVRVSSSELLPGQLGLFACADIKEGTVITCFGDVRESVRVGEDGKRTRSGYSITVKKNGGRTLAITPHQGVTEGCVVHAINHTCHTDFENCKFVHPGITNVQRGGGAKGRESCKVQAHQCRVRQDNKICREKCRDFRKLRKRVPVCRWVCVPFVLRGRDVRRFSVIVHSWGMICSIWV